MSIIDSIFLLFIAVPFAYGLWRGIVRVVISTLSLFLGIVFARQYSGAFVDSLKGWVDLGRGGDVIAFIACFAAVVFLLSMLGKVIRKGIKGANLGMVDRLLGACLGGALGVAVSFSLIFLIFHYMPDPGRYLKDSRLAPSIVDSGSYVLLLVPPWIEDSVREGILEEYNRLKAMLEDEKGVKSVLLST
jgi:membrane protein required for colicin V production